jgi:hypothetical protein
MESTIEKICSRLSRLQGQLIEFLEHYSKVKRTIFPGDSFFSAYGDYSFLDLPAEAISVQNKLFKDFNLQLDIIEALIINSPSQYKNEIKENKKKILRFIQQDQRTWEVGIPQIVEKVNQYFDDINKLLIQIYPNSDQIPILIPDTNALYLNVELENWVFNDFKKFTIILTPSVLRDLDKHKIEHKNETIRTKAVKLINIIKEYRRRGKLIEGIKIKDGRIDLKSIGTEPNFSETLKWLDERNEDDRLIAEALEIMRSYCNRPVLIVTADINLQNKCEVADFAYIEPPILSIT